MIELKTILLEHELIPEPNKFIFIEDFYKTIKLKRDDLIISEELICYKGMFDKIYSRQETWWLDMHDNERFFEAIKSIQEEGISITWEGNIFDLKHS